MIHQLRGASCLAALRPNHDPRPALDEIAALGFNAVRGPFCGALPWANQELRHVYDGLGRFLGWCGERGLNAYIPYVTEAGTGFDLERHVDEVEAIAREFPIVVLRECGNEADHPSQGNRLPPERCRDLAARMSGPAAYGATIEGDESDKYAGGAFVAVHLDRGRDHRWNMVRRVREILAMADNTGKFACNQEPIGAGEVEVPGKRCASAEIFYTLGALNRLFLGGNGVFHSQAGLMAERLGPVQRRCAEAYLAGVRAWPGAHRLSYANVGHAGAPVVSARFNDGRNEPGCTRSYFGGDGNEGLRVTLGIVGDPELRYGNGWRPDAVIGQMAGVQIVRDVRQ